MQFKFAAVILATMASVIAAQSTVYVTVCVPTTSSTTIRPSVVASSTVASTGVRTSPTPTGSPIAYATGAAAVNAVSGSALGLIIAGGVALLL